MIPVIYLFPYGTPLYWGNEQSGQLPAAVVAFLAESTGDGTCSEEQRRLVIEYLKYYIAAPCWEGPGVQSLRERAAQANDDGDRARTDDLAWIAGVVPGTASATTETIWHRSPSPRNLACHTAAGAKGGNEGIKNRPGQFFTANQANSDSSGKLSLVS
jgi:hypothetical protein